MDDHTTTCQPIVDCKSILTLTGLIPSSELTQQDQSDLSYIIATLLDTRPHIPPAHPVSHASLDYVFDVVHDDQSLTAPSPQHNLLSSIIKVRQAYGEAESTHQDHRYLWDEYDEYTSLCCELGRAAAIAHNEYVNEHGKGERIDVREVYGMGPNVYCASRTVSDLSHGDVERADDDSPATEPGEDAGHAIRPVPTQLTTL